MSDTMFDRWARRKEAVAKETEAEKEAVSQDVTEDELEANRLAAEAVDLDSLGPDSDLGVFLKKGVPELLKNQAMRTVWRSDPVFANLDELVDYGEDFGAKSLIMETFQSAWKVGEGYLKQAEETLEKVEEMVAEVEGDDAPEEASKPETQAEVLTPDPEPSFEIAETEPETPAAPTVSLRRRMGV